MRSGAKASNAVIRRATREDAISLSSRLRKEDLEEIGHGTGLPAELALLYSLKVSDEASVVVLDGEPIIIFGINGYPGQVGFPWMLASEKLKDVWREFTPESKAWLKRMLAKYQTLENKVWAGNTIHIRWLKWLGFQFEQEAPHGINDEPFMRFFMKEENV